jgi:hypothetical protein
MFEARLIENGHAEKLAAIRPAPAELLGITRQTLIYRLQKIRHQKPKIASDSPLKGRDGRRRRR